jgi:DNA invertase Pin-like site-specific DNA recombinase
LETSSWFSATDDEVAPSRRGKLIAGIFAALAALAALAERELISERPIAGLASARARGRTGGWPFTMTPAKVRLAMASMGEPGTKVNELCRELVIFRQTLRVHVSPNGEVRPDGARMLARKHGTERNRRGRIVTPASVA